MACSRNQTCELQQLGFDLGVTEQHLHGQLKECYLDVSPAITRDTTKCVLCRRCVTECRDIQGVGAISAQNRGFNSVVAPPMDALAEKGRPPSYNALKPLRTVPRCREGDVW